MSFVHLHLHSEYSLLDGAITIDGLIDRVKKEGMPAVALTDHGNLHGALEFHQQATAAGVAPIIGIEAYITQGDRRDKSHRFPTHHIVLLAQNRTGLKNLQRLMTLANMEGYYYKPRMDREILKKYSEGLVGLSACLNGVPAKLIQEGREDLAATAIEEYREIFGDGNYYLELMNTGVPEQIRVNETLVELGKKLSLPMVGTNDCHYLNREDAKAHDILLCIGMGKTVGDQDRMRFHGDNYYLKSAAEMKEVFSFCPEAVSNTLEIAKKCSFELDLSGYHMPRYEAPEGLSLDEHLTALAKKGLEERFPLVTKAYVRAGHSVEGLVEKYHARLESELEVIRKTGFSGYFLIVQDFINHAKQRGIPVGPGRGSAAGSLVAFATRITDIDPIPYNLLFERFLNPERISMPDIDVDFCQDGRDEVIRYVSNKYGGSSSVDETKVAQITTFGKMQARAVIRDVGRALDMPYGDVDRIAKLVPAVLNITLLEAFEQEPKFSQMRSKDPRIDELLQVALSLEGLVRHASVHAAGVVISDDRPLVDHLPMYRGQHEEVVTQWDMKGVEKIGLIKFDFLGLKTLTLLARAVTLIREVHGEEIDLLNLDLTDAKTYELLSRADTAGVFQLESSGMRDLVAKLKPSTFEDIIALVALYRPGPLGSGMVEEFIERKHGRIPISYDVPTLESILRDTYGVILYQEQVMQIAADLANYSLGEADLLRRAMGKKIAEEMAKQEERFLQGCRKNKLPELKAKKIFDLMAKFAGYGFNKSHSAAYAMLAFQTAYLKSHYPVEFMAACLSIDRSNTDKVVASLADCRENGIEVLPPDVNQSQLDFSVSEGKIRFGLAAVKNVGEVAIEGVMEVRRKEGDFKDLVDFCRRVDLKKVNRRVMESLIKCGAFDSTGRRRSQMTASLDAIMEDASKVQKDRIIGQQRLFGGDSQDLTPFRYLDVPEWDEAERLRFEKESVGFYVSGHPLLKFSELIGRYASADCNRLRSSKDQSIVRIGGMIASLKEITTRKGDRMAFATLEDLSGSVELVVFSDVFREKNELFKSEEPIFVIGKLDISEEQAKIIVTQAALLKDAAQFFSGTVHIHLDATSFQDQKLMELKRVIGRYKGECPTVVHFQIPGRSETILTLSREYSLAPSDAMITELHSVLGPGTEIQLT